MILIKLTKVSMVAAGLAIALLGVKNLTYIESVPNLRNLNMVSGKIVKYNCDSRTKYEDYFSFTIEKYSRNIEVEVNDLKCSKLINELKSNNWLIKAWIYSREGLTTAYAIEIGKYKRESMFIGTKTREPNILSILMVLFGVYLSYTNIRNLK